MDNRIIEFIHGLRAAGVRVSMAESQDALQALAILGAKDKTLFKESLRVTLVKEVQDFQAFNELFPLYFGSGGPPLQNAMEQMSADEQNMIKSALSALSGRLEQLLEWLTQGNATPEELAELARQSGADWADHQQTRWVTRRALQQLGYGHLEEKMQELMQKLQEMGMSQEAINRLMGVVDANRDALAQQVAQQVGRQIGDQLSHQRERRPNDLHGPDLLHKSFNALSSEEMYLLRREIRRLTTQLRTRAALRRKKGANGKFDAKNTIRASQKYAGIPFELKFKKQKLKPNLVLICDVSVSMQHAVEFILRLVCELQDQISHVRSFAFYGEIVDMTTLLNGNRVEDATVELARDLIPSQYVGPWCTDLGNSLHTFSQKFLNTINNRTTVIILGDGRNGWKNPRTDLLQDMQRRAKRLVWFNPESQQQWSDGDSDMWHYYPYCDQVYQVRNLAQLSAAIDKLLVD